MSTSVMYTKPPFFRITEGFPAANPPIIHAYTENMTHPAPSFPSSALVPMLPPPAQTNPLDCRRRVRTSSSNDELAED
ncbi:unnamed protein product [Gongylonema pulchrum]|uniref:Uncharacterized protein n=1 Tax=Gongylonema pulchrum TaxID=637853 RepID=A0A183EZS8_9BILA|nr:unnamed protein product [Gongylonema pulchrum]